MIIFSYSYYPSYTGAGYLPPPPFHHKNMSRYTRSHSKYRHQPHQIHRSSQLKYLSEILTNLYAFAGWVLVPTLTWVDSTGWITCHIPISTPTRHHTRTGPENTPLASITVIRATLMRATVPRDTAEVISQGSLPPRLRTRLLDPPSEAVPREIHQRWCTVGLLTKNLR